MSEVSYGKNTSSGTDYSSYFRVAATYEIIQDKYKRQSTVNIKSMYFKHLGVGGAPALGSSGSYHVGYGFDGNNRKTSDVTFGAAKGQTITWNLGTVSKTYQHDIDGYAKDTKIYLKFLQPDHIAGSFYMPHFDWIGLNFTIPRLEGIVPTMGEVIDPKERIVSETTQEIVINWNKATSYNKECKYVVRVSIDNSQPAEIFHGGTINTTTYTYKLEHNKPGTTYKFSVCAENDIGESEQKESGVITLNEVLSPIVGTIPEFNPYLTPNLSIPISGGSQTMGGSIYRKCSLYFGSLHLKDCETVSLDNSTMIIKYPINEYLKLLGDLNYMSQNFQIIAWGENQNGTKSNFVYQSFVLNINTDGLAAPTFDTPTISGGFDKYPTTCFIKNVSDIIINVPNAKTNRALPSTVFSYEIKVNRENYTTHKESGHFIPQQIGDSEIYIKVTDTRGLYKEAKINIYVQDYSSPVISNLQLNRKDTPNTNGLLTYELYFSPIYSFYKTEEDKGEQINKIQTQGYTLDDPYTTLKNCISGSDVMGLDVEKNYTLYLKVADFIKPEVFVMSSTRVGTMLVDLALRDTGIGINCVPQSQYRLEVNGDTHIRGTLTVNDVDISKLATDNNDGLMGALDKRKLNTLANDLSELNGSYTTLNSTVSGLQTQVNNILKQLEKAVYFK